LKDAQRLVQEAAAKANKAESYATNVHILSIDITDFNALEKKAADLCCTIKEGATTPATDENSQSTKVGPPTLLFNCAGYSIPLSFTDLSPTDFFSQVNVNYLGSIHVVKAFLPYMLGTRQQRSTDGNKLGGNIILTSSMSGQVGSYGYSAYSPTKFALRGFAESLAMELDAAGKGANHVNISLAYPPDTNTPGYEAENQKKPEACRLISESGGIWDPEV
jgi:3-dehydrosphinganine reductase